MLKLWMRGMMAAGLGLVTMMGSVRAQDEDANRADRPRPAAADAGGNRNRAPADLPGPIDSPKDLQDTAKLLFMMADTNKDGQISKEEATNVGHQLVGGFFFRADADGDGVLTQEEARQARQEFLQRQPILRLFVREIRRQRNDGGGQGGDSGQTPFQGLANLIDADNDQQIKAAEARQAVETAVEGTFAATDTNRDGQLSPSELNAAAVGLARAAGQAVFQSVDNDNDGALSREEFEKAIVEPARVVFGVIDTNKDDKISQEEAQQAQRMLMDQLQIQVPDAGGRRAPIPDFGTPDQPSRSVPRSDRRSGGEAPGGDPSPR